MERQIGGSYYSETDARRGEFLRNSPPPQNISFLNFISGLEDLQPTSAVGNNLPSYDHASAVSESDPGLEALQHGFGGWTRYPTDDNTSSYPAVNINANTASPPVFTADGYFRSLSQPDAVNDFDDEYYTRARSHSEHFDLHSNMTGCDMSTFAQRGRETYSDALGEWNKVEAPEPKIYDPFGTDVLLKQPPVSPSTSDDIPRVAPKLCRKQFCDAIPEVIKPCTKNKPSYSEVAKNSPCEVRSDLKYKGQQHDSRHRCRKAESLYNCCKIQSRHLQHSGPHSTKCLPAHQSSNLEPKTIKPNSRYGLDTFEDPVTCSTRSSSRSRKGSASSSAGSYCGVEELHSVEQLKRSDSVENNAAESFAACDAQTWMGSNCNEQKENSPSSPEKQDGNVPLAGEKLGITHISNADTYKVKAELNKNPVKVRDHDSACSKPQEKERVFFDPKRIFSTSYSKPAAKKSQPASSNSQHCLPNNQHNQTTRSAKQQEQGNLLNNDKPNTKMNTDINRSCYINNNLHEPSKKSSKKQVNAEAQRESAATGSSNVTRPSAANHSCRDAEIKQPQRSKEPHTIRREVQSSTSPSLLRSKWDQLHLLAGELMILLWQWIVWAGRELGKVLWNVAKLIISIVLAVLLSLGQDSILNICYLWKAFRARCFKSRVDDELHSERILSHKGLQENIVLPSTGDEAMKRLLANKGKDPYSILGVRSDVSDEMIKKYYRRQAVLVHPDKNQMPGAEEAFKILGHAFDLIGEPEKRKLFDTQRMESQEEEEAFHQFADLLNKLHEKMQEAATTMGCETCGGKHQRIPTDREIYCARYCQTCNERHSVKEGDVWAESHMLGFRWNYYACMENKVYDITELVSCQSARFKHIEANAHYVAYRIATQGGHHRHNRLNESELEELLNQLFQGADGNPINQGGTANGSAGFAQYGTSRPSQSKWNKPSNTGTSKKSRRRKKRH